MFIGHKNSLSILILLMFFIMPPFASAEPSQVKRQLLNVDFLPQLTKPTLTSLTVEINPGETVGAHKHDGFVYAYVLEGKVRSKLDNGDEVDYEKGAHWVEQQGVVHTLTANISKTDTAKILVVFIAEDGVNIIQPLK